MSAKLWMGLAAAAIASTLAVGTAAAAAARGPAEHESPSNFSHSIRNAVGDNDWIRPDCLQPDVAVQGRNGETWMRKSECGG